MSNPATHANHCRRRFQQCHHTRVAAGTRAHDLDLAPLPHLSRNRMHWWGNRLLSRSAQEEEQRCTARALGNWAPSRHGSAAPPRRRLYAARRARSHRRRKMGHQKRPVRQALTPIHVTMFRQNLSFGFQAVSGFPRLFCMATYIHPAFSSSHVYLISPPSPPHSGLAHT